VGLKRKIRTLLDREKRLFDAYERQRQKCNAARPFPLTAAALLRNIDLEKLNAIRTRYSLPDPGIRVEKYLEMEKWLTTNVRRILNMGLDFQHGKRVLDLGCGVGQFLYICRRLGHEVLGLDMPNPAAAWYGEVLEVFGVPRLLWRIDPFVPLPDLGGKFDYVTSFMVCFNDHLSTQPWGIAEWRFLLDDLSKRLNPGAIVWMELNPGLDGKHYTPDLGSFFESRGAILDGKRLVCGMDPVRYKVLLRLAQLETKAMREALARPGGGSAGQ
jgi:SAM-dependent methyltransferase